MDSYSRPIITSLDLAYGLADTPFTFTLYTIYTLFFTLMSYLIDINFIFQRANITLKLPFIILVKYEGYRKLKIISKSREDLQ